MSRIGIVFTSPLANLNTPVDIIRQVEQRGFTSAWQAEDPGGPDAVSMLASYARVTERLRLGTAITTPYARHPVLLATTFATLDDLSGGRMILGLGAGTGWWDRLSLDREGLRPIRDMAETVRAFRELLATNETEYNGRRVDLRHGFPWHLTPPPPLIRDRIPVYIGSQRPQMVRLAGRIADGLIIEISPIVTGAAERVRAIRAAAEAAGRNPDDIDIVALAMVGVTRDGQTDRAVLARWVAPRLSRIDDAQVAARGFDPDRFARLRRALADGQSDTAVDLLTPDMIAAIGGFGSPDDCLAWLDAMVRDGVHEPIIFPVSGDPQLAIDVGAAFAARRS